MCKQLHCKVRASFGFKHEKANFCKEHKKENMINVVNKKCLECDKRPNFGYKDEKNPIYCVLHKKENMVDVKNKKCLECDKQPKYGLKNEKAIYCSLHKKENMINVVSKKCLDCDKYSNYNFKNEKRPIYCLEHKKEGMVCVSNNSCLECDKRSNFSYKDEKIPIYCSFHKKENMVNIVSKMCLECDKIPYFNLSDKKNGIYCLEHKKENMINIKNKKCLDCDKIPSYNLPDKKTPIYCSLHKKENMINVISKMCKSEWCDTRANKKYQDYCLFCFVNLFPDNKLVCNYKTKEKEVNDFIKLKFPNFTWTSDKIIEDGCSKRRPDLLLDLGYQVIILEIDENQHHSYEEICENKRTMEISKDLGFRPIIFIRFNPDNYDNVTSCWSHNKLGVMSIKKNKKIEWEQRLNKLTECINFWIENKSLKTIEINKLFYDTIQ
jgi:hypothetical protein